MSVTEITATTIKKARADSRPGAPRYEVTDARSRGLVLRVGPAGAGWQYRWKRHGLSKRLALGDVDFLSIAEARDIANAAGSAVRNGLQAPTPEWLHGELVKMGKAERVIEPSSDPRNTLRWTWTEGRDAYLADVTRTARPSTAVDYKEKLNHRIFDDLEKRPLASVTRQEIAGLVAGVHRSGTESTAAHLVRVIRPFFGWLAEDAQADRSGVEPGIMTALKAPRRSQKTFDPGGPVGAYVPGLAELARIIVLSRSDLITPVMGGALELLCWTLQRRMTIARAVKSAFRPISETEGVWLIESPHLKSGGDGHAHVVPLPAPAWRCVQRAIGHSDTESPWLFPAARIGRKTGKRGHLHQSSISHTLGYLPGVQASPHDVRRAFGTYGESELGLERRDTSAILDHSAGGLRSDVTGRHYALHDGTHWTWPIMRKWSVALEIEIENAAADPELSNRGLLEMQFKRTKTIGKTKAKGG